MSSSALPPNAGTAASNGTWVAAPHPGEHPRPDPTAVTVALRVARFGERLENARDGAARRLPLAHEYIERPLSDVEMSLRCPKKLFVIDSLRDRARQKMTRATNDVFALRTRFPPDRTPLEPSPLDRVKSAVDCDEDVESIAQSRLLRRAWSSPLLLRELRYQLATATLVLQRVAGRWRCDEVVDESGQLLDRWRQQVRR